MIILCAVNLDLCEAMLSTNVDVQIFMVPNTAIPIYSTHSTHVRESLGH